MKLQVHNSSMILYIQYKFHEILFISYLIMAEDGRTDRRTDGRKRQHQTNISPPSVGDNTAFYELSRVRQVGARHEGLPGKCYWMFLIIRKMNVYGLGMRIWMVSEILVLYELVRFGACRCVSPWVRYFKWVELLVWEMVQTKFRRFWARPWASLRFRHFKFWNPIANLHIHIYHALKYHYHLSNGYQELVWTKFGRKEK